MKNRLSPDLRLSSGSRSGTKAHCFAEVRIGRRKLQLGTAAALTAKAPSKHESRAWALTPLLHSPTLKLEKLIMYTFYVFVTAHSTPGFTQEEAHLKPGAFSRIYEKTVRAAFESETEEYAIQQVDDEICRPDTNVEAYNLHCRIIRLDPLKPVAPSAADQLRSRFGSEPVRLGALWPEMQTCSICHGLGFVFDIGQELVPHRCPACKRFRTEDELHAFIYAKLTGAADMRSDTTSADAFSGSEKK